MIYEMPEHRHSVLLTQEENDLVFSLVGYKCETLATTVIELYTTGGPKNGEWYHKETGILCLVKDSNKRSYFFRIFCPIRKRLLWEHEVYNNIQYITPTKFLHTFEAENCIAGFNFASEEEGSKLHSILVETLEIRKQRRVEKNKRNRYNNSQVMKVAPYTNGISYNSFISPPATEIGKKEGKRKQKLSKADIGQPQDFRHVSHVGWDPHKGFDLEKADDPQLKEFFVQAGVSETHLRDKETREFIYDFIIKNGGIDAVKEQIEPMEPPPIPARFRAPPKPPVKNLGPPPPPPQRFPPSRNAPSIPKQIAVVEPIFTPPPPPPPPGPPPMPIADDSSIRIKSAVLEELTTKGRQLKPLNNVTNSSEIEEKKPPPSDSRGQLMDQIRKGIDLKPVSNVAPVQNRNPQPSGLASALAIALANRKQDIQGDSSSTSDSDEAFDDEEWDD
ncbi:actin nucleation-promoting factor WASL [Halyomorpha halys]|uniref:actin nucleation-promoting factor WASL n=1 Tax=Halyomorpha halys TaxID=286706 RepID=UPI0006D4FAC1|nr:neural Wiskott-Aldrich syndrome protein [Halyomorpha halys]